MGRTEPIRYARIHGAAQLRSFTEIEPKSPYVCVNRSPIWYGAGARAIIHYCVNIGFKYQCSLNIYFMTISIGAHRIDGDGVEYRINKIITHPAYGASYQRNDIALLRLVKPVTLDSKVGTVCFHRKAHGLPPGTRCWISGFSPICVRCKPHRENIHKSV